MTSPLWLARARLRRNVPAEALVGLLLPAGLSARMDAGHKLVWTLFADHADRRRDFLWRELQPGQFMTLSARQPMDQHGIFELDPPKEFAPVLREGDRLAFSLRANATVARGGGPKRRGKPCDVVMDALFQARAQGRSDSRPVVREEATFGRRDPEGGTDLVRAAGLEWLGRQGARHGFAVDTHSGGDAAVTRYETVRIVRPEDRMSIGVLDFEGILVVKDPALFLAAVAAGFGRAKGFGCGLMLIRRV